jgi:hypothetical protein
MISRRVVLRRLFSTPTGLGLSLLAVSPLSGCWGGSTPLPPLPGNRNDQKAQRDVEVPPGLPVIETAGKKKRRR